MMNDVSLYTFLPTTLQQFDFVWCFFTVAIVYFFTARVVTTPVPVSAATVVPATAEPCAGGSVWEEHAVSASAMATGIRIALTRVDLRMDIDYLSIIGAGRGTDTMRGLVRRRIPRAGAIAAG